MSLGLRFTTLVEEGRSSGRLWLYSNYHCNLACNYCLTASSPHSPVRGLTKVQMMDAVHQAKTLGFTSVGVTGMVNILAALDARCRRRLGVIMPVIVLTNGTMLTRTNIRERLLKCRGLPVQLQISVDDPDPQVLNVEKGFPT